MGLIRTKVFCIITVGFFLLLPIVSADEAPPSQECLAYAYSDSESHSFLVKSNASLFGNVLNVVHDCESLQLWVDGEKVVQSNSSFFEYEIEQGIHNISLLGDGFEKNYSFVSFYPDRLEWRYQWIEISGSDVQFIEVGKATLQENWASFLSIIITWFLSTYVYWQFVQTYVQRNYIEEVIN